MPEHDRLTAELDGTRIGTPHGSVVCDGCNAGIDLGSGNRDVDNPHSADFTGYATEGPHGWELRRVFCQDCNKREIQAETDGFDEAVIEFMAEFLGIGRPPVTVTDIEVLDRSRPEPEGTTA